MLPLKTPSSSSPSSHKHYFVLAVCAVVGLASLTTLVYGNVRLQYSFTAADDDLRQKRSTAIVINVERLLFRPALHKASPAPHPSLSLDDVFVSVKTSQKFHQKRLKVILDTWFNIAPHKVKFWVELF